MSDSQRTSDEIITHTISESGRRLGVCRMTVHRLIERGELRPVVVGKRRRISTAELVRFIERAEARAAEDATT